MARGVGIHTRVCAKHEAALARAGHCTQGGESKSVCICHSLTPPHTHTLSLLPSPLFPPSPRGCRRGFSLATRRCAVGGTAPANAFDHTDAISTSWFCSWWTREAGKHNRLWGECGRTGNLSAFPTLLCPPCCSSPASPHPLALLQSAPSPLAPPLPALQFTAHSLSFSSHWSGRS